MLGCRQLEEARANQRPLRQIKWLLRFLTGQLESLRLAIRPRQLAEVSDSQLQDDLVSDDLDGT